jgi:DNA-binding NarL/FixJ family response regulator
LTGESDPRRCRIRVLIVDGQPLFADALAAALGSKGIEVTPLAADGDEAAAIAKAEAPDAAVLDLSHPSEDAISVGERILSVSPGTKLLGLARAPDEDDLREVLDSGFHGVMTRNSTIPDLTRAITAITRAHTIIPSDSVRTVIASNHQDTVSPSVARKLTAREREILGLLAKGATGGVIAKRLYLSPHTVRTHIQNILLKLGVHSRLEAVALATRRAGRTRSARQKETLRSGREAAS